MAQTTRIIKKEGLWNAITVEHQAMWLHPAQKNQDVEIVENLDIKQLSVLNLASKEK